MTDAEPLRCGGAYDVALDACNNERAPLVPFSVMLRPGTAEMDMSLHSRESDSGPPPLVIDSCTATPRTPAGDHTYQLDLDVRQGVPPQLLYVPLVKQ